MQQQQQVIYSRMTPIKYGKHGRYNMRHERAYINNTNYNGYINNNNKRHQKYYYNNNNNKIFMHNNINNNINSNKNRNNNKGTMIIMDNNPYNYRGDSYTFSNNYNYYFDDWENLSDNDKKLEETAYFVEYSNTNDKESLLKLFAPKLPK